MWKIENCLELESERDRQSLSINSYSMDRYYLFYNSNTT